MNREKLVVIGNGMAGMKCIEELLNIDDSRYEITVFGSEPYPNYNRIMLSKVLQGNSSMDDIVIHPWTWYEEKGIQLYTGTAVTKIDTNAKQVEAGNGIKVPYDRLILATGSEAFIPKLPGVEKAGVTGFRNIQDCLAMMDAAKIYHRAAVIGGGILGLEAAKGLLNLGMDVHIVHNAPHIMNRQLDSFSSELLRKELESQGMRFLLNKRTEAISGRRRAKGLLFDDGTKLAVDYIVFAVGINPRIELAEGSGLKANRAFIVDDYMQTNIPDVYAVGECAEHRGIVYGLVAPLYEQGKVLARTLCGVKSEPYCGTVPFAQLKISGIDVFSAGNSYDVSQAIALQMYDGIKGSYKKVTMSGGKVSGAILYGDINEASHLLTLIQKQSSISELYREPATNANDDAAAALAPKDTVCSCNGVCKADIINAVCRGGLETIDQVRDQTKASGSCGGCRPLVEAVIRIALELPELEPEAIDPICGCCSVDHPALLSEIAHGKGLDPTQVMRNLNWKTQAGCTICQPAIQYYLTVHGKDSIHPKRLIDSSSNSIPLGTSIQLASEAGAKPGTISFAAGWLKEQLEQSFTAISMPEAVMIAISGGTLYPAGVYVSGFGVAAVPAGWELYVGGHGELPLRQAELLALESSIEDMLELAICSIQLYRESAYFGEPVWEWLERIGIVNIREKLHHPQERQSLQQRWKEAVNQEGIEASTFI